MEKSEVRNSLSNTNAHSRMLPIPFARAFATCCIVEPYHLEHYDS